MERPEPPEEEIQGDTPPEESGDSPPEEEDIDSPPEEGTEGNQDHPRAGSSLENQCILCLLAMPRDDIWQPYVLIAENPWGGGAAPPRVSAQSTCDWSLFWKRGGHSGTRRVPAAGAGDGGPRVIRIPRWVTPHGPEAQDEAV